MIMRNNTSRDRWKETSALIIDESESVRNESLALRAAEAEKYTLIYRLVSMIDARLFDKLEWLGRKIRGKSDPFGGLQVYLRQHSSPMRNDVNRSFCQATFSNCLLLLRLADLPTSSPSKPSAGRDYSNGITCSP